MLTIHFYAGLRELAKTATLELYWQPGMSAASLRETIAHRVPDLSSLLAKSSLAVNDVIVDNQFIVPDGADVALLPPVSGG